MRVLEYRPQYTIVLIPLILVNPIYGLGIRVQGLGFSAWGCCLDDSVGFRVKLEDQMEATILYWDNGK